MNTKKSLLTAFTGLALAAGSANAATILYQDDFDPGSGDLAGHAPNVDNFGTVGDAQWQAAANNLRDWQVDGSIDNGAGTADRNGHAFLPFTPEAGKVYTLSIDLNITSGEWFALGFMSDNTVNSGGFFEESTGDGSPWMLLKADGSSASTFTGPGTGGQVKLDARDGNTVSIELDTTGTDWVATFRNGSATPRTHTYTGTDISDDINYVGFGRFTTGVGSVDNFSLTVVPEPGSLALLGLGGLCLIKRRRRAA